MAEIKWDIKRGADIYRSVLDDRIRYWISTGKIKPGEVVVWKSGFSGWRKPEELPELIPYFRRYEKAQLRKIKRRKPKTPLEKVHPVKNKFLTGQDDKERGSLTRQIKNILIIDDENDLCELLTDTLTSRGYNVACVTTKKEALRSIKRSLPELVFLDLRLPDGDGMELVPKIKRLDPDTVVNIISAYGGTETKEKAMGLGVNRFIDKPFSEQDILKSTKVL